MSAERIGFRSKSRRSWVFSSRLARSVCLRVNRIVPRSDEKGTPFLWLPRGRVATKCMWASPPKLGRVPVHLPCYRFGRGITGSQIVGE